MTAQSFDFESRVLECEQHYASMSDLTECQRFALAFMEALPPHLHPEMMTVLKLGQDCDVRIMQRAVERLKRLAQAELDDPCETPEPRPVAYGGNVVEFPGNA